MRWFTVGSYTMVIWSVFRTAREILRRCLQPREEAQVRLRRDTA
jgi:hypothetical protein